MGAGGGMESWVNTHHNQEEHRVWNKGWDTLIAQIIIEIEYNKK